MSSVTYRSFRAEDLAGAYRLSQEAGWPHRLADWQLALSVGQGIVAVDDAGEVAATGLVWFYGETIATLGLMIVSGRHRRMGIGGAVMKRLLDLAGGRSILLHATADGEPLYAKLGFVPTGHIYQHQGEIVATTGEQAAPRALREEDVPAIITLDAETFGAPRERLIRRLTEVGEAVVIDDRRAIAGASFRRPFGRGASIGPLIARDETSARAMLTHWLRNSKGFLRIDLTEHGEALGADLSAHGMPRVSRVVRMVKPGKGGGDPLRKGCLSLVAQALG